MRSLPKPNPFNDFADLEMGRNKRYLHSLALGFERGIWRAPASLLQLAGWPVLTVLGAFGYLAMGVILFVVCRIYFVTLGLLGLLRPKSVRRDESALTVAVPKDAL